MNNVLDGLSHLSTRERLAVTKLLDRLEHEHSQTVLQVMLYGSGARGGRRADSDVDLLIITRRDDWREQEPIRLLAARLSNEYDVFLSTRVMSLSHYLRMRNVQPLFYQSMRRDAIVLLRLSDDVETVEPRPLTAS